MDTTGNLCTFASRILSENPKYALEIQKEIKEICGNCKNI
jgi:hypothetical protein